MFFDFFGGKYNFVFSLSSKKYLIKNQRYLAYKSQKDFVASMNFDRLAKVIKNKITALKSCLFSPLKLRHLLFTYGG